MQQQYHLHQSWLWLLLLPLLSLSSCSGADTDDAGNLPAASTMPISFTALSKWDEAQAKSSTSPHTRLSEDATTKTLSFDKNDAIGVFAYLNSSETPNFMNNQKVTYDGVNWNYSPVKYWPNNEADKLSFYAYYPQEENPDNNIVIGNESSGNLILTYNSKKADVDLMVASNEVLSYSSGNGRVALPFKHLLAKIRFRFRNDWEVEKNRYRLAINYLHFSCNTNNMLTYDFKSKKAEWSDSNDCSYDPSVINIDGYYPYSKNDFADIVAPFYFVPDLIKQGKIELGLDVMQLNSTTGIWEKITAHSTPTYIMQADLQNDIKISEGASLVCNISFKPSSGLTITMITEVDGWKEIDNDHKI